MYYSVADINNWRQTIATLQDENENLRNINQLLNEDNDRQKLLIVSLEKRIDVITLDSEKSKEMIATLNSQSSEKQAKLKKFEDELKSIEKIFLKKIFIETGYQKLMDKTKVISIEDQKRVQEILKPEAILSNLEKELIEISKKQFLAVQGQVNEEVDKLIASVNENKEKYKFELEKIENNIKSTGWPDDILVDSMRPLRKHVDNLDNRFLKLKQFKEIDTKENIKE